MNPFEKLKNIFEPTKYVRDIFNGKKAGDTFEVKIPEEYTLVKMRGIIQHAMKKKKIKYKTKTSNGKLYVYIIEA